MLRTLKPVRRLGGTISMPGDKSIAHRVALMSIISHGPLRVKNFPGNLDCLTSLKAAQAFGVQVSKDGEEMVLTPPEELTFEPEMTVDCGNSGTTARLLAGIISGKDCEVTLAGDESLSRRPMKRIIAPLSEMGAEVFADEDHLPMRIRGRKLMPFEYRMPVASAQVKSSLLLAGMASSCSVTVREETITRDHTERMVVELGEGLTVTDIKPITVPDPDDPRKKRREMPEDYKREIRITGQAKINGGAVDIPGDISTASFFLAAAAISGRTIAVSNVGLNPTRTGFLDYLRSVGAKVEISDREVISGEPRGTVTVTGDRLKAKKISGSQTVALIDEIPIVAVMAAFANGTTVIRNAGELKVKESDRLQATAENLKLMGIKCGLLADGLVIDGGAQLPGTDFKSFGDHRIAMAFSIASLFLVGPSTIDDDSVVGISCPDFYEILDRIKQ